MSGLEDRSRAGIALERLGAGADHDLLRAVIDGVGQQLGARARLVQAHARQLRELHHAQDDDDRTDDRRDA
jgi:hypothetical protein